MYHRFPRESALEAQCAHLKKYYRPISLTEVGWWLQKQRPLPPQAIVFTVDDGYRDFFVNAFPVLSAYSIPAMVYLATDMIDQGSCLWVDWVRILYRATALEPVGFVFPDRKFDSFRQISTVDKNQAAFETKEALKKLPNQERLRFLERLPGLLGIDHPPPIPEEYTPLNWEEVRLMAKKGIEFGAHTRSHPILSKVENAAELQREIGESKARIDREVGTPALHFCYPNGNPDDFTAEAVEVIRGCGYLTAVTGVKGINFAGADPFQLKRIHQEPVDDGVSFRSEGRGTRGLSGRRRGYRIRWLPIGSIDSRVRETKSGARPGHPPLC